MLGEKNHTQFESFWAVPKPPWKARMEPQRFEREFGMILVLGSIAVAVALHILFQRKSRLYLQQGPPRTRLTQEEKLKKQRKDDFLKRAGGDYGYRDSPAGFIDCWRKVEFPNLIAPLCLSETSTQKGSSLPTISGEENTEVYLDYAGSALPSRSLLNAIHNDAISAASVLANPHSSGPAAARTLRLVEEAKKQILDNFHGHPGRFSAVSTSTKQQRDKGLFHPGYDLVFTSGTTEALRIIAEQFPWSNGTTSSKSILLYPHNAHTSVVGMRGAVLAKGGAFLCRHLSEIIALGDDNVNLEETLEQWATQSTGAEEKESSSEGTKEPSHNLLVFPTECNFGGFRVDAGALLKRFRRLQGEYLSNNGKEGPQRRWFTVLDLAKAVSTSPVNLKELDPDFACLSFYKIFGAPTGLGVLFVRRSASNLLTNLPTKQLSANLKSIHRYFGGGSVDVVLSGTDFAVGRSLAESSSLTSSQSVSSSSLASLVHGTMHFRGVVALKHVFQDIQRLGDMKQIQGHANSLARELCSRLLCLRHQNQVPVIALYGAWGQKEQVASAGPVVAFNLLRSDGTVVGYNEVAKLAALNRPPLQLRSGCFCNPGACQEALELTDKELIENYTSAGHVCGDEIDIVNGKAVGAIRASFGKESLWEDLDALVLFIENHFVTSMATREFEELVDMPDAPMRAFIAEMYIYPIKSCTGQAVVRWDVCSPSGRLQFDREFALVDSFGTAMRLQKYPKMGRIRPEVDLDRKTLKVSAPNMKDLVLRLDSGGENEDMTTVVSVCGNKCSGKVWGDLAVSEWFSSYLGVQCWLARYTSGVHYARKGSASLDNSKHAFSNEKPILLICQDAVDTLNAVLKHQNQPLVSSKHFRPNLVVQFRDGRDKTTHYHHPEDSWTTVEVVGGSTKFTVQGHCSRCAMVDVNPMNGTKGKTLRALAAYRRNNSDIHFGIFLQLSGGRGGTELETGAEVICQ